ncbi:MAG TPA: hypothetical protein VI854_02480, partial [Acidimicrobiia bacterium]|nr:hypothetical protein [Acidimicrobiia bacterium]
RDEVVAGQVDHAIRLTASRTDRSYVWPARHQAGEASNANLPPMGAWFRLRSSFDVSGFRPDTQVVLRAMQRHGLIVADNGSDWYFTGTLEEGWDMDLLDELKSITAGNFEAVDASSLMVDPDSGRAKVTAAATTTTTSAPTTTTIPASTATTMTTTPATTATTRGTTTTTAAAPVTATSGAAGTALAVAAVLGGSATLAVLYARRRRTRPGGG